MSLAAQTTWDVWRRILKEPALQATVKDGKLGANLAETGFAGDEVDIARYYQTHFKDAAWFVTSYRFRVVSAFVNAVELGAPLTHRVLLAHGREIRDVAEAYYDDTGWLDDGPYVYGLCAKILDWLPVSHLGKTIAPLTSVAKLEAASVQVLLDATDLSPSVWSTPIPDRNALLAMLDASRMPVWTGRARVVETGHDIAPLFLVKGATTAPIPELPKKTYHFAAYLPDPEQKHRFARVSPADFDAAQRLAAGTASPEFIRSNIGSYAKFAKIRAVGRGD
ncbi:hypothetical protein [Thalassococcus sp. S3]|uniref:hypothetical protein n=1 Tax=Thalassococcus sp. S3 TaxID=2017482 RepID=UPI001023FD3B|nr:hypothetical protein [Thalassococcus sp. S3]QBF33921.1 hypothetical protein CFI11_22325 [Thalassococcus sp. S3]